MKKSIIALLSWVWMTVASFAAVPCTLPFNLQNGVIADATQVMANYNALVTCLSNAAAAGANSDITSLTGLTTPLSYTAGGASVFIGGTATNVSNAYTVGATVPTGFSLTSGFIVSFIPTAANTGPATLVVAGTASANFFRQTATGPLPMVGGELQPNQVAIGFYDGTQFECINCVNLAQVPTGTSLDFSGVVIPTGFLLENGAAVSRTTYSVLFNTVAYTGITVTTNGTTTITVPNSALFQVGWYVGATANIPCNSYITSIPGGGTTLVLNNTATAGSATMTAGPYQQGDCATTFNLPNYTGKVTAGVDGSTNLTASTCPNAGSIGDKQQTPNTGCGAQNVTIAQSGLPNVTLTVSVSQNNVPFNASQPFDFTPTGSQPAVTAANFGNLTGVTSSINGGVGQTGTPNVQPTSLVYKIIKT